MVLFLSHHKGNHTPNFGEQLGVSRAGKVWKKTNKKKPQHFSEGSEKVEYLSLLILNVREHQLSQPLQFERNYSQNYCYSSNLQSMPLVSS